MKDTSKPNNRRTDNAAVRTESLHLAAQRRLMQILALNVNTHYNDNSRTQSGI